MKPDEAMDLLREAHREPIPEAHFARVRARVLSQIAAERNVVRHRWWYSFVFAAAVALLLIFWPKTAANKRVVARIPMRVEEPIADVRESVNHEPAKTAPEGRRLVRRKPPITGVIGPPNPTPLVVKMLTDDPNVVIYWISERTGE